MNRTMDRVGLTQGYKLYTTISENPVDRKTYNDITTLFIKHFMMKVFEGLVVKMGARLGAVSVRGKKAIPKIDDNGNIRGIAPSWGKTKESWTAKAAEMGLTFKEFVAQVPKEKRDLVYCFNEHSDGNSYKIYWHRDTVVIKNVHYYNLRFSFHNKRQLSKHIFEGREFHIIEKP